MDNAPLAMDAPLMASLQERRRMLRRRRRMWSLKNTLRTALATVMVSLTVFVLMVSLLAH